jgi:hypothetical protein
VARLRLPDDVRTGLFEQALKAACERPEILSEAEAAGIAVLELVPEIRERETEAWATVQDEEAQFADVLEEQRARTSSTLASVAQKGDSAAVDERVARVQRILMSALVDSGILPLVRAQINARLEKSFDPILRVDAAPGLAETTNDAYDIPTSAAEEVARLIGSMSAGSIGIAGPRGAGKSTLIRRFVSGRGMLDGRKLVSVVVSAPVEYEPRDFVLHLFERLTNEVAGQPLEVREAPVSVPSRTKAVVITLWIGVAAAALGAIVLIANAFSWTPNISSGWILGALLVLAGLTASILAYRELRWRAVASFGTRSIVTEPELRFRAEQLRKQINFQQSFTEGWSGSLRLPAGVEIGTDASVSLAERQLSLPDIVQLFQGFVRELAVSYRVIIGIDEIDKIENKDAAHRFLNDVKAVFGIEGCYYLVSISEDAMSDFDRRGLPFRDAFDSAFDEVVRVDFLKLRDTNEFLARRVIGMSVPFICLSHCVSGGLPRDVIRVAREIVARSERPEEQRHVAAVARGLILAELMRKCDAVSLAARSIAIEPESGELIRWVRAARDLNPTPEALGAHCASAPPRLCRDFEGREANAAAFERLRALAGELVGFVYFAATVLQFFAASVGRASLEEGQLGTIEEKRLDRLAEARQLFAINAAFAWERVSAFRNAWGYRTHDFPLHPRVGP